MSLSAGFRVLERQRQDQAVVSELEAALDQLQLPTKPEMRVYTTEQLRQLENKHA